MRVWGSGFKDFGSGSMAQGVGSRRLHSTGSTNEKEQRRSHRTGETKKYNRGCPCISCRLFVSPREGPETPGRAPRVEPGVGGDEGDGGGRERERGERERQRERERDSARARESKRERTPAGPWPGCPGAPRCPARLLAAARPSRSLPPPASTKNVSEHTEKSCSAGCEPLPHSVPPPGLGVPGCEQCMTRAVSSAFPGAQARSEERSVEPWAAASRRATQNDHRPKARGVSAQGVPGGWATRAWRSKRARGGTCSAAQKVGEARGV